MDGMLFSLCLYLWDSPSRSPYCAPLALAGYVPEYLAAARLEVH
jgi:hypothetical protein